MSRLLTMGFELNSLVTGMEIFNAATPGGSIQTSIVHGGTYAYRNNPSGSTQSCQIEFNLSAGITTIFLRFYYYVTTHPANNSLVLSMLDTSNATTLMRLRGTGSGLRAQNSGGTQVGSDFALNTGQWYRIEVKLFSSAASGTIDVLVDGVSVVSVTGTGTNGASIGWLLFGSGASLSHDYYIDDVAVNTNAGSQNSYPGDGKIICLRPASSGDSSQWTRGGADSGVNWSQANEITPNDATNYIGNGTLNNSDMYGLSSSGIGGSDTVNVVQIGMRYTNNVADGVCAFKIQVEKASGGTILQSSAFIANSTTWRTNGVTGSPGTFNAYPIVTYLDPDGVNPWTAATLATAQIGEKITTAGTHNILLTAIWAMVDYTPSAGGNTLKTVNGLAATSIKTIQTLARASVKAYDGLTPP